MKSIYPWALLALLAAPVPASAGEEGGCCIDAGYLSPETLREQAAIVVRGTIAGVSTTYIRGHVYTDYHVRILETLKGRDLQDEIVVRQIGGTFGSCRTVGTIPLRAEVGQEWILALARPPHGWWTVHGVTQGAFRVVNDAAIRGRPRDGVSRNRRRAMDCLPTVPAPHRRPSTRTEEPCGKDGRLHTGRPDPVASPVCRCWRA